MFTVRRWFAVVAVGVLVPGAASAAVRYVKVAATGAGDCSSWANACTLTTALPLADASTGDQVWVKAGTYAPFELKNGVKIIGGFAGAETAASQSNPTVNVTIIDGGESGPCVWNVNTAPTDPTAVLRGFKIRRCRDDGSDEGGAFVLENSNAHVVNCIFEESSATHFGGAGCVRGAGSPQFVNCVFRKNGRASANPRDTKGGGAVFVRSGTPLFVNCLFDGNLAGEGGAVLVMEGFPTFVNCTLVNNQSIYGRGGAIFDADGRVTLKNSILWNNKRATDGSTPDQIYSGAGGTSAASYSNIQGGWVGSTNLNADPQFVSQYGGDLRLTSGSPCKNAGDTNAIVPDSVDLNWNSNTIEPIPKDLGLLSRVQFGVVDMGAYEFLADPLPPGGGEN